MAHNPAHLSRRAVLGALAVIAAPAGFAANGYPARPIKLVVGYAPAARSTWPRAS